jgi:hypothetical protein
MEKSRIVTVGDRPRGRYATPADFPLHGATPYRGLRVRRWGLGFVHHSRAILCRAVPNPSLLRRLYDAAGTATQRGGAACVSAVPNPNLLRRLYDAAGTTTQRGGAACVSGGDAHYAPLDARVRSGALAAALSLGQPLGRTPADWLDHMLTQLMRANRKVGDARVQIASRLGVRASLLPLLPSSCPSTPPCAQAAFAS